MPTIPSIRTSIENQSALVLDEHAKQGTFLRDKRNRLIAYTGGFTAVFPYVASNGEKWAFRCWHSDIGDMRQRMQCLSEELRKKKLPYFCEFEYVERGIVVDGDIFPTTRMKWIEGENIKSYICSHRDKKTLKKLADDFLKMCETLHANHIAHGDLQHENILVDTKGKLYLVDYDSVYLPAMGKQKDIIVGKPDYQHPQRKHNKWATERLDYFSELIIYLSIRAMAEDLSLIDKYQVGDTECLLFAKEDFENWYNVRIVDDIEALGNDFKKYLDILSDYLSCNDINVLEPFMQAILTLNPKRKKKKRTPPPTPHKPIPAPKPVPKPNPPHPLQPKSDSPPPPPGSHNGCLITLLIIIGLCILIMLFRCSVSSPDKTKYITNARIEQIDLGDCYYTGYMDKNGLPHGRGEARFDDGRIYRGEFKHGIADGENAYFRSVKGNVFEGTFSNNRYTHGKYTSPKEGWYFWGKFRDGEPYNGTYYSFDGYSVIGRAIEGVTKKTK